MRYGTLLLLASLATGMSLAAASAPRFTRSADGLTVHDDVLQVTWLADANLPASQKFGLPINDSGSMTFQMARRWVAALNASNRGAGYLGRNNWTMPAAPITDGRCSVARGPHGNSFGFNCTASAMGSLYYEGLGVKQPNTVVPIPPGRVGPFKNFQPYLYWSLNGKERAGGQARRGRRQNGDHAFSFNTGWQGGNVSDHVMYVLPMIPGRLPGTPAVSDRDLHPSADGQTVFDPISNVTWLANANLAAETQFGVSGIVSDGAMTRTTADDFIAAMNRGKGYLGQKNWQLPPTHDDPSCTMKDGGYNCSGSPMGSLYHHHLIGLLGVRPGEPVVRAPDVASGPFHNIQPYLYWACAGGRSATLCSNQPAAPGFQWSFSFGNGFQGTDVIGNSLYVMVFAPDARGGGGGR